MIPFEVKSGRNGLNKQKIKNMLLSPKIKNKDTIKGNMLGILSRTPINSKPTDLITDECIPLTKKFGLIIREKVYNFLKNGRNGGEALLSKDATGAKDQESKLLEHFRNNHKFFGLEDVFKNFADEYFSNKYPEAVLYHTLEHMLNSGQKIENKDDHLKKLD